MPPNVEARELFYRVQSRNRGSGDAVPVPCLLLVPMSLKHLGSYWLSRRSMNPLLPHVVIFASLPTLPYILPLLTLELEYCWLTKQG